MEQRLYEAAIRGRVESLREMIGEDELILDKFVVGCFKGSPLHAAASCGRTQFVDELLNRKQELAEVYDSEHQSALHLASAKGHVVIVKALIMASPYMCLSRDRDGRNPLHIAVMKGKVDVVKELLRASPEDRHFNVMKALIPDMCISRDQDGRNPSHVAAMMGEMTILEDLIRASALAARVMVDGGDTILHLCVKHNQLETMELLLREMGHEFVNAKDSGGNTILHLAVLAKQFETIEYLLQHTRVYVKATNANGFTALDMVVKNQKGQMDSNIEFSLRRAVTRRPCVGGSGSGSNGGPPNKDRDALMVVASLIATMAFQAGVNPPGGVWQDTVDSQGNSVKKAHRAGEAIMAYSYPDSYKYYIRANTLGFVASLSVMALLLSRLPYNHHIIMRILLVTLWFTITSMAFSYAYSTVVITPKEDRRQLSNTLYVAVPVWCGVITIILLSHTIHLIIPNWLRKCTRQFWPSRRPSNPVDANHVNGNNHDAQLQLTPTTPHATVVSFEN